MVRKLIFENKLSRVLSVEQFREPAAVGSLAKVNLMTGFATFHGTKVEEKADILIYGNKTKSHML